MKQMLCALALLVALVAGSCLNNLCLDRTTGRILSMIDESGAKIEEKRLPEALTVLYRAKAEWEDSLPYLSSVLPHDELDDVTQVFARSEGALLASSYERSLESMVELRTMLSHLTDIERLSVENIL